jgi:hypothetical protein
LKFAQSVVMKKWYGISLYRGIQHQLAGGAHLHDSSQWTLQVRVIGTSYRGEVVRIGTSIHLRRGEVLAPCRCYMLLGAPCVALPCRWFLLGGA